MGHHELDQFAHQVVGHGQLLGPFVIGRRLHEVPVAHQPHHIVVHPNVRFENLAGAGIAHVRPEGVGDIRREPADGTVPGILGIPVRILLRIGGIFSHDRVGESRRLEGRLPLIDTRLHKRLPLVRHFAGHIKHNGLDRVGHFRIGILLFQTPTGDIAHRLGGVLGVIGEIYKTHREESDPIIVETGLHGIVRQLHHAVMDHRGDGAAGASSESATAPAATSAVARGGGVVGRQHPHFDVARKRLDGIKKTAARVHVPRVEPALGAELIHILGKEVRNLDDHGFVLAVGEHVEDLDDGGEIRLGDRDGDGIIGIGADAIAHIAEQDALAAHLPAHHPLPGGHARIGASGGGLLDCGHPEHVLAQLIRHNFVIQVVPDDVRPKEADFGHCLVGDDLVVGLDLFFVFALFPFISPAIHAGPASAASRLGEGVRCHQDDTRQHGDGEGSITQGANRIRKHLCFLLRGVSIEPNTPERSPSRIVRPLSVKDGRHDGPLRPNDFVLCFPALK